MYKNRCYIKTCRHYFGVRGVNFFIMSLKNIGEFESAIGYVFQNKQLLERALTHSSFANEQRNSKESNERMEFLGDAVLSLAVSEHIFSSYHLPEGELTRIRASLVCEEALFEFARQVDLGSYLFLGKGERQMGGGKRPSVLADAFEAVIAAIYLDGGFTKASEFVLKFVKSALSSEESVKAHFDYKTKLQEIVQKNPGENLRYALVDESGPDHKKTFEVQVFLNSNCIGTGVAGTKKRAEQLAAKEALLLMGEKFGS